MKISNWVYGSNQAIVTFNKKEVDMLQKDINQIQGGENLVYSLNRVLRRR